MIIFSLLQQKKKKENVKLYFFTLQVSENICFQLGLHFRYSKEHNTFISLSNLYSETFSSSPTGYHQFWGKAIEYFKFSHQGHCIERIIGSLNRVLEFAVSSNESKDKSNKEGKMMLITCWIIGNEFKNYQQPKSILNEIYTLYLKIFCTHCPNHKRQTGGWMGSRYCRYHFH